MPKSPVLDIPRNTPHYRQGAKAYRSNRKSSSCPYKIGDRRRVGWMSGWLDARTKDHLAHVFEKHDIEFP